MDIVLLKSCLGVNFNYIIILVIWLYLETYYCSTRRHVLVTVQYLKPAQFLKKNNPTHNTAQQTNLEVI